MAAKHQKIGSLLLSLTLPFVFAAGCFPAQAAAQSDVLAIAEKPAKSSPRLMLSGAVIRYDKISKEISKEQWLKILDEMSSIGIKTIVIEFHHFVPRQSNTTLSEKELDFLSPGALPAPPVHPVSPSQSGHKVYPATPHSPGAKTSLNAKALVVVPEKKAAAAEVEPWVDASAIILEYADVHHMDVYMGLWMDQNWYGNLDVMDQLAHNLSKSKYDLVQLENELTDKKTNPALTASEIKSGEAEIAVCKRGLEAVQLELDEKSLYFAARKDGQLAGPCLATADALVKNYGKHSSFAGWYMPEPIWDAAFSSETISVLNPLLKFISGYCREISSPLNRPFIISPYASRLHYDAIDEIVDAQIGLLKDSGVDILMLQDSIGDLNLKEDDDISVRLKKHFTAFSKVAAALKLKLWAEVEPYEQVGRVRKPSTITRFKKQFQFSHPYLDKNSPVFIAFDYLKTLSLNSAKYPFAEERAKLFDEYKREFVDGLYVPPTAEGK